MFADTRPALMIVVLQRWRCQCLRSRVNHVAGFDHERHGLIHFLRLAGIGLRGLLERRRIRAVAGHAIMQTGAAGDEALCLGIIRAMNQTHEFAGDIAMEPWRTEGIFGRQPARRKNHEVHGIHTGRYHFAPATPERSMDQDGRN